MGFFSGTRRMGLYLVGMADVSWVGLEDGGVVIGVKAYVILQDISGVLSDLYQGIAIVTLEVSERSMAL